MKEVHKSHQGHDYTVQLPDKLPLFFRVDIFKDANLIVLVVQLFRLLDGLRTRPPGGQILKGCHYRRWTFKN